MAISVQGISDTEIVEERCGFLLWISGLWIMPLLALALWILPASMPVRGSSIAASLLLAPLPAFVLKHRQRRALNEYAVATRGTVDQLKLQLDTVRYRTARLREELQAADKQARLSHQLTLLGQFTAGFMHEFNNPLAIVVGRLEVLLEERKDDPELHADLEQMLKETRYMGQIAGTLLQALRRERGGTVYDACVLQSTLEEAVTAIRIKAETNGIRVCTDFQEVPRVDLPEHVILEVVRGLCTNAIEALKGRDGATIWVRMDPYRTAGNQVIVRVEDNGPGVPEEIQGHLFEPFVSHNSGRERLGLGLFLAASLLDMYDGRIRYEKRNEGGACFVIELPPARFTKGQPYHWFVGATE
ncbi:MAG: HAMP domain-containing histidine kinase [Acidobacteriota bacterium]|nr:HAMP domain-containing histidine kinase [Acidobacteriota bacterium]